MSKLAMFNSQNVKKKMTYGFKAYRRRIELLDKTKVVASVLGT